MRERERGRKRERVFVCLNEEREKVCLAESVCVFTCNYGCANVRVSVYACVCVYVRVCV